MPAKRRDTPSKANGRGAAGATGRAATVQRDSAADDSSQVLSGKRAKTSRPPILPSTRHTDTISATKGTKHIKGNRHKPFKGETLALDKTSRRHENERASSIDGMRGGALQLKRKGAGTAPRNAGRDEEIDESDEQDGNDSGDEADDMDEDVSIDGDDGHELRDSEEEELDGDESENDLQSFKKAFPGMSSDEDEEEGEDEGGGLVLVADGKRSDEGHGHGEGESSEDNDVETDADDDDDQQGGCELLKVSIA